MDIEITKYEKHVVVEPEIERLQQLVKLIDNNNLSTIKELLESQKKISKSGIYSGIESDICGFYELEQTLTKSWVLRSKFRGLDRNKVKKLLLNRINSVNIGIIELPENLFEVKAIRLAFDTSLIDVEEVSRRSWDYILYKSTYYEDEFYVKITFEQSFASWSKNFKLTESEVTIAKSGKDEEIIVMVDKKRSENRS